MTSRRRAWFVCLGVCAMGLGCAGGGSSDGRARDPGDPLDPMGTADAGTGGRDATVGPSIAPPRPIAPLSTSTVTTRRPTLELELPPGTTSAIVELCRDRACTDVIETVTATGETATPAADLPHGVVFWRLRGGAGGEFGGEPSATWQMNVPAVSAPTDTYWGSTIDVNGDGFADVVSSAQGAERVYVFLGSASGVATEPAVRFGDPDATMRSGFGARVFAVGDVNGDGFGDVAIGDASRLHIYHAGSAGLSSTPATTLLVPGWEWPANQAGAGDIDRDGYSDLALMTTTSSGVSVYVFHGGPDGLVNTPTSTIDGFTPEWHERYNDVAVADFDGDRYADVVASGGYWRTGADGESPALIYYARGSADGLTPPASITTYDPVVYDYWWWGAALAPGDFDGDGRAELAMIHGYDAAGQMKLVVFWFDGASASASVETEITPIAPDYHVLHAADFDNDGRAELIAGTPTVETNAGQVHVLAPSEERSFSLRLTIRPPAAGPYELGRALTSGDVDGDGFLDLVVGAPAVSASAGAVLIYRGGTPAVGAPWATLTGPDGINGRLGHAIGR